MFLRLATASDLGAMTWVLIGASPLDPIYPYRFPDRHLYADKFAELCRQKCAEYLATSTVVVCEMPADSDPARMQVVAFSAWDAPQYKRSGLRGRYPYPARSNPKALFTPITTCRRLLRLFGNYHDKKALTHQPLSCLSTTPVMPITIGHRDRMNVFRAQCSAKKHELFDTQYTRGHMFLKILLCHPDYQRRGAGRALTMWGIEEARRLGLDTTVFASPMGFELYQKLGFREIGRFRVQLDGEEAYLEIPALVLRTGETRGWGKYGAYTENYGMCTSIACT